jgi:hypothetical protein
MVSHSRVLHLVDYQTIPRAGVRRNVMVNSVTIDSIAWQSSIPLMYKLHLNTRNWTA